MSTDVRTQPGELPAWMYPTEHGGLCYDPIGAIAVGAGAAGSPLLAAASAVVQHLLTGDWHLRLADLVPDLSSIAVAFALAPLSAAALCLYRHWRQHRAFALVEAENEALLAELVDAVRAGELDLEQLLADLAAAGVEVDTTDQQPAREPTVAALAVDCDLVPVSAEVQAA